MEDRPKKTILKRALMLMTVVTFLFVVFAGRILYIQTGKEVNNQDLKAMAEERWTTSQTIPGERGTIYARNGSELAKEMQSYTVFAILDKEYEGHVEEPEKTAEKLAPYINMDENDLASLLKRGIERGQFQVELGSDAKYLTLSEKEKIEDLELPGIYFRGEKKRYYPKQVFASHVLGYTTRNMEKALMGLEKSFNDQLKAKDGSLTYKRNVKGFPLLQANEMLTEPKDGQDIYLTIDSQIQTALEQAMTKVDEEYSPNKMTAIVASAETGEILALGNRPSFNPNQYETIENYTNYAVSDRFEPGSTMKIFTLAAAMEEGVYNGNETFQSGSYTVNNTTVGDHNNGSGWGPITYDEGLERSSNVAFAKLALEKLKTDTFYEYLKAFGFNDKTGVDLPNEVGSLIANSSPLDAATTSFGQGTAVTPIQLVQAATAVANDGNMMKPYVVDKIYNSNDNDYTYEASPEIAGSPISKETAAEVRKKLERVVTGKYGTGHNYQIDGIDIAGKTGTAQINNPDGPGYISGYKKNIFSFLGMAPADDPKIIVYVAVDRPQLDGDEIGSEPVAKVFNPVMKQSLSYMSLAYEETSEEEVYEEDGIEMQSFAGQSTKDAVAKVKSLGLSPVVIGNGKKVEKQYPKKGEHVIIGEKMFFLTDGKTTMPDMKGWSLRDAKRLSVLLQLKFNHVGSGYVTKQSLKPGSVVKKEDYLTVELKGPGETQKDTEEKKQSNGEDVDDKEPRE